MSFTRMTVSAILVAAASTAFGGIVSGGLLPIAVNTNGTNLDGFALVALSDIAAGEVLYITDNELTTTGSLTFNSGESYSKWTVGVGGVSAGSVVLFSAFDSTTVAAVSQGSIAAVSVSGSTNRGLSATAESLYFYTAASDASAATPLTHVAYLNIGNATDGQISSSLAAAFAVSLTNGADSAQYTGARAGQNAFGDYAPLIGNTANWTTVAGQTVPSAFDTTAFTIIPAPGSVALVGMGAMIIGRRRRF